MFIKSKVAAIEFAGDEVRVAVIKAGGASPKVLELVSRRAEYEDPEKRFEALVAALDDALNQLRNRPAAFILCESSLSCIVRTIAVPLRGHSRVAAAVPAELEPHLAFPLEDILLDYVIVAEFDGETEVLAMGMRRSQVEDRLAILDAVGIEAEAITVDAAAITGLWQAGKKKNKGLTAVLHVREGWSSVVILHHGKLAYVRHLSCTGEQVRQASGLVAREVQNSIRGFLTQWRGEGEITELHVTGVDFTPEERNALSEAFHLSIQDSVLISQYKGGALALQDGPMGGKNNTWEAVVGAAFNAAGGSCSVNFRQSDQPWQKSGRTLIPHLLFTACVGAMFLAGCWLYYSVRTDKNNTAVALIETQIGQLKTEIDGMKTKGLGEEVDTAMYNAPPLIEVLKDLAERLPDNVVLTDLRISAPETESWWLKISGTVADAALFNQFMEKLKESALYRVDEEPDRSVQGSLTTFTVKAYRKEGGDK